MLKRPAYSLSHRVISGWLMLSFIGVTACAHVPMGQRGIASEAASQPTTQPTSQSTSQPTTQPFMPPVPIALASAIQTFDSDLRGADERSGFMKVVGDSLVANANKKGNRKYLGDADVQAYLLRGISIRAQTLAMLNNPDYRSEAKIVVIRQYIQHVILPTRQLVSLLWTDFDSSQKKPNPALKLMVPVPSSLVTENSPLAELIASATDNRSDSGVFLKASASGDSDSLDMVLSPMSNFTLDVQALSYAPTKDNYIRAMKLLTIQTILQQQQIYNILAGDSSPVQIPLVCREHLSVGLPAAIELPPVSEQVREATIAQYLAANGIIGATSQYRQHFKDNVRADPLKGGFSGYLPFERYHAAQAGLGNDNGYPQPEGGYRMQVGFDDDTDFENVLVVRGPAILDATPDRPVLSRGKKSTAREVVREIMAVETSNMSLQTDAGVAEIDTAGMSKYLVDEMRAHKQTNWEKVVPRFIVSQLSANQISLDLPPLEGPEAWTRWGLHELGLAVAGLDENDSRFADPEAFDCRRSSAEIMNTHVTRTDFKICLKRAKTLLARFATDGDQNLLSQIDYRQDNLFAEYPMLMQMWRDLRDQGMLPAAQMSEWSYIKSAMGENPWVSLRVAYLMAKESTYDAGKQGFFGSYVDVLAPLGQQLELDKPMRPLHANRLLNEAEKKTAWAAVNDEVDTANVSIFRSRTMPLNGSPNAYSKMDEIARMTILDRASGRAAFKALGFKPSARFQQRWDELWSSPNAKASEDMLEIYKARGDVAKQKLLFTKFAELNGWDNDFDVKTAMYDLDTSAKDALFEELLTRTATLRRGALAQPLNDLCKLQLDGSLNNFKDIYYRTIRSQAQVNQIFGARAPTKEVMEDIHRMSQQDWDNMKMAGYQFGLIIGVSLLGGACIAATGGFCAVGTLLAAGGASLTQVLIFKSNVDMYYDEADKAQSLQLMADLGLTTPEVSAESIQHGKWSVLMEAAFCFPLLGAVAKSSQMGLKFTSQGARKLVFLLGRKSLADLPELKTVAKQVETSVSRYALKMTGIGEKISYTAHYAQLYSQVALLDPLNARFWSKIGRAVFRNEIVRESPEEINRAFGAAVADYFGNQPARMLKLVRRYTGKRLLKQTARIAKWGPKVEAMPEYISNWRIWRWPSKFTRWRYTKAVKKEAIFSRLKAMEPELQDLVESNAGLAEFTQKHAEDLGEILFDLPMVKSEVPYFLAMTGSPAIFSRSSKTMAFSGSLILKRMAIARDNLLAPAIVNGALQKLGLREATTLHTGFEVLEAFRNAVLKSGDQAAEADLDILMDHFAGVIESHQRSMGGLISKAEILEYFASSEAADQKAAEILFNTTPITQLFAAPKVEGTASSALLKLAKYDHVDEFQNFLSALRVTLLSRKAIVPVPHPMN